MTGWRLENTASPYLRAHADDAVDWFPWGEEAFAEARRRDVPLFISIGYSTCHWCHVFARESFRSGDSAADINASFVAVKVDREEHPDVDAHYLAEAERFTGRLGWPLSVFSSPNGRVGYAGTYFPPVARGGQRSFRDVLAAVRQQWNADRFESAPVSGSAPENTASGGVLEARAVILGREDPLYGGFGTAAKFLHGPILTMLTDLASTGDDAAADLVDRTLRAISQSPLRDPVDGGIFRYATGRDWSTPHYERMLADNAQLLRVLAIRGAASRDSLLLEAAASTANYLLETLALPDSSFATAQDSESIVDGRVSEGGYYRLSASERLENPTPAVDRKVLAGINGLAIGAFATAGRLTGRREWIDVAEASARSVEKSHRLPGGRLRRVVLDGVGSDAPATLEDHGLLATGLLDLALATGRVRWAAWARELVDATLVGPEPSAPDSDPTLSAVTSGTSGRLLESAAPSGLSAIGNAARTLYLLTGDATYDSASRAIVTDLLPDALEDPFAAGALLALAHAVETPGRQLITVSEDADLASVALAYYRASSVSIALSPQDARAFADAGFSVFDDRPGPSLAYLCDHFICALPLSDPDALRAALSPEIASPGRV